MKVNRLHYQAPTVFVSSTSGGLLNELRKNLGDFLGNQMGYLTWMWENGEFFPYADTAPTQPDLDAITAVRDCHIYILLIGPRYGTIRNGQNVSITHEEFLNALDANIPIYAFVKNNIWNSRDAYFNNPQGDFSAYVEDVRVYDFIRDIMNRNILIRGFEYGDEIISILRRRFANLSGAFLRFSKSCSWIWCEETTEEIEGVAEEMWIATPDLYWDWTNEVFRRIVQNNVIQRGVRYKYIILDTEENRERYNQMIDHYVQNDVDVNNQIDVTWLSANDFIFPTETAIYNPNSIDLPKRKAIFVNAMEVADRNNKYNVMVGPDSFRRLLKIFSRILTPL